MDFMTYQQWLLLRPLIVFLMAIVLLLVAVVVGWFKERRKARRPDRAPDVDVTVPAHERKQDGDVARVERSLAPAENSTPRVGAYLFAYISDRRAA
jgi:hypothetical protein